MQKFSSKPILISAIFLSLLSSSLALETQDNPFLAKSSWPIAHQNTWNTDSSSNSGPRNNSSNFQLLFDLWNFAKFLDPISLVFTNDNKYFWASSITGVFKVRVDEDKLTEVGYLYRDLNFEFHGAYALISDKDIYYTAGNTYIGVYGNEDPKNPESKIVNIQKYEVPNLDSNEHLVGLSMTHDNYLVYVTNYGKVAIVSIDFSFSSNVIQLKGQDELKLKNKMVSNSFAVDKQGGIYVVSSKYMNKVNILDGQNSTKILNYTWVTQYHKEEQPLFWGRLGTGSGSSPTLMGNKKEGKPEFVVTTDGHQQMSIQFFRVEDGALVGNKSVTFGGMDSSQSEQSIVVKDYQAVVVNNYMSDESVSFVCKLAKRFAPAKFGNFIQGCPFLLGQHALGVEQFEIDPQTYEVKSNWVNKEVSCTSSIPVVSEKDKAFYCLGKRDSFTLESLSWETGKSYFSKPLGSFYNPLYAGTEIGPNNELLIGTILGPIRIKDN